MISFAQVSKSYRTRDGVRNVLNRQSFVINKGESLGICGHNGAVKSTLLRMIAGIEYADEGEITRDMSISWPIGYASAFQSSLTGIDNVRFIARIYGKSADEMVDIVDDFAELGSYMRMPVRTYSAGMNARLAFATSLAVEFDCYLVDEITGAGDERFRTRCEAALKARRAHNSLIMVSHDTGTLKSYCDRGVVLRNGVLRFFDSIDDAIIDHFSADPLPA